MIKLLITIYFLTMSTDNRKQVRQVIIITLLLNLIALLTGSLSLFADALHSITDSANNILGLITNHLATSKADRETPTDTKNLKLLGLWVLLSS